MKFHNFEATIKEKYFTGNVKMIHKKYTNDEKKTQV